LQLELITLQYTITIADIVIIMLLVVLIKRMNYDPKDFLRDIMGEASWVIALIRYLNDFGDIAEIGAKVLKKLIINNVIDKETAVKVLARVIAENKKKQVS